MKWGKSQNQADRRAIGVRHNVAAGFLAPALNVDQLDMPTVNFRDDQRYILLHAERAGVGDHRAAGVSEARLEFGGKVYSSPAARSDGSVIVGCQDDSVYAVDATGAVRWHTPTGGDVDATMLAACIRVVGIEREATDDRAVDRPRPGTRRRRQRQDEQHQEHESAHC